MLNFECYERTLNSSKSPVLNSNGYLSDSICLIKGSMSKLIGMEGIALKS